MWGILEVYHHMAARDRQINRKRFLLTVWTKTNITLLGFGERKKFRLFNFSHPSRPGVAKWQHTHCWLLRHIRGSVLAMCWTLVPAKENYPLLHFDRPLSGGRKIQWVSLDDTRRQHHPTHSVFTGTHTKVPWIYKYAPPCLLVFMPLLKDYFSLLKEDLCRELWFAVAKRLHLAGKC